MDMPDPLLARKAVNALAILTAIPVVSFALWGDYFGRAIQGRREAGEKIEPPESDGELYKVRLAALVGLIVQFMLFVSSGEVRKLYPLEANLMFIGAMFVQMWLQSRIERQLQPPEAGTPGAGAQLALAARAFAWSVASGVLYISILIGSLQASFLIAKATGASPAASVMLMIAGTLVGVLGGLGLGFALGPFQLRRMFRTSQLEEPDLSRGFRESFERAGVRAPEFFVLELDRFQAGNAMITGFQNGRGPFRPGLFLSRNLLTALQPGELQAVILHEISHLKLRHLRKRLILSSGLILATGLLSGALVILSHLLLPGGPLNSVIGLATVFASFIMGFRYLEKQSRLHEIEADIEAVKLGAQVTDLSAALRKIDRMNGQPTDKRAVTFSGHPATEERIAILQAYFKKHPLPGAQAPAEQGAEGDTGHDQAA